MWYINGFQKENIKNDFIFKINEILKKECEKEYKKQLKKNSMFLNCRNCPLFIENIVEERKTCFGREIEEIIENSDFLNEVEK